MLAQEVRQLRIESGLSQSQFAGLFGVSPATIAHWESGRSPVPALYIATMTKLKQRLQELNSKKTEKKQSDVLMNFFIAGGIIAFLAWLFSEDKK